MAKRTRKNSGPALGPTSDPQPTSTAVVKTPEPVKEAPLPSLLAGNRGLQLRSLDDYWRFARAVASSGIAPKGLERPESILVALQMGAEIGLPPMAALQNIAVINGRPSIFGDAAMAVARSSPAWDETSNREWYDGAGDDYAAHCQVGRVDQQGRVPVEPHVASFSIRDAKRAGLWGKAGPWVQYPQDMLMWRARHRALKAKFSDVLRGFELQEVARDFANEAPVQPSPRVREIAHKAVSEAMLSLDAPKGAKPADVDPAPTESSGNGPVAVAEDAK